ncbi:MAG: bifunctional 3-oxoadipate enol-lactonase/4-carboxymuconolactone decarboxylase PcaDC [Acidobacteriota bacterium]
MPRLAIAGTGCYYRLDGGDDLPVLILAHSLGQDHGMWDPQAADLAPYFRVLRYDVRGHGGSDAPPGEYRLDQLGHDALALADALGIRRFAFCGLSLGGMIGQWLASNVPDRVSALVLANTSPRPDATMMEARRRAVLEGGVAAVADAVMARFFAPAVLAANPPTVAHARRTLMATSAVGYAGCCAAVRDTDVDASLSAIRAPTLVICGDLDVSLPWKGHGERLSQAIPHARVSHLRAAHLSNLETPRAFTAALCAHLLPSDTSFDAGLRMRRAVLGDEHVDRALATRTELTGAFQDLITRGVWGEIWTRPGLDPRTRRLMVLAVTAALGRWEEFRLHVRAALRTHALEPCEVTEVLLQLAVYAGAPAANSAFKAAEEEMSALGLTPRRDDSSSSRE